ncbi:MAG TPA: hypothetical protein VK002_15675 [Rubricoccaceae bacterium]|jgi:hypothetical protein|nr:hypothetical protein [Rubricoccaceae bacterium]
MTALLEKAVAKARALPEDQQNALAALILEEIEDEARWDETLARPESQALLARMAEEAMSEHRAGKTRELDPDTLGDEE